MYEPRDLDAYALARLWASPGDVEPRTLDPAKLAALPASQGMYPVEVVNGGCCGSSGPAKSRRQPSTAGDGKGKDEFAGALRSSAPVFYGASLAQAAKLVNSDEMRAFSAHAADVEILRYQAQALQNAEARRGQNARPALKVVGQPAAVTKLGAAKSGRVELAWHGVDAAISLDGGSTSALARAAIEKAQVRIWVTQFVIDVRPAEDRFGEVRSLLRALAAAAERGVDVRVMVPVVDTNRDARYDINEPAVRFLLARSVSVLYYSPHAQRPSMHAKPLLIDDLIVFGNGNWTASSFRLNGEISVAIRSAGLAASWRVRFERLWRHGHALTDARHGGRPKTAPVTPPLGLVRRQGLETLALLGSSVTELGSEAALCAGQGYVRELLGRLTTAKSRAWVVMFGLRASKAARLRRLIQALADATSRGLDVRVLMDPDPRKREIAAGDVGLLRSLGVPVRAWPLRSRLHARAVLVDDRAFVGSLGWTPASVFLTEEAVAVLHDEHVADAIAKRIDLWWSIAGAPPAVWPIEVAGWPGATMGSLQDVGAFTLGAVVERASVPGISPASLAFLQRCAAGIIQERLAPGVAWVAARSKRPTQWWFGRNAAMVDDSLRPRRASQSVFDLTPAGRYLEALPRSHQDLNLDVSDVGPFGPNGKRP